MARVIAGVGGLLGAAATIGGAVLIASGRGVLGAALIVAGFFFMALLIACGLRLERRLGTGAAQSSIGSASTRALLGAGAVLIAIAVGVVLQRVTG